MCNPIRLAVLVSGNGTNLQAFIDAIQLGELNAQIAVVLSDNPDAYALERANGGGIPVQSICRKDFLSKEAYELEMVEIIQRKAVDLILLAGFMRILSPTFLRNFPQKVLNIHPSLLPAFKGLDAQGQALNYGVKLSGCTVHFVDEGMDTGPIIQQAVVPVLPGDTREELALRIQKEEHRIFLEAVKLYQAGKLKIEGRRVKIMD